MNVPAFGVGFDLPWGERGFATTPGRGEHLSDRIARYLAGDHRHDAVFGSFQPKGRAWLDVRDYERAWDDFAAHTAGFTTRTLHHTLLNLGAVERYDRSRILALTNALIEANHGTNGLLHIANDNDSANDAAGSADTPLLGGQEMGVTLDARTLSATNHFSYNGEEGATRTADRFIFADANINGGNVIDGGAVDNVATTNSGAK